MILAMKTRTLYATILVASMTAVASEVDIDALCPPRPETAAKFEEGAYPPPTKPWREAAIAAYRYMAALPAMTALVETGRPYRLYQHNAYVSKTHAAHIDAMLLWAREEPKCCEKAMRLAKASAEFLLGELEPADAALAFWPPTYSRKPLEFNPETDGPRNRPGMVGNEPDGAVKYRGEVMLVYPADVGCSFLAYHAATKDSRFLTAAVGIGDTYIKTRRPDGSWPLKMKLSTGEPVGDTALVPTRPLLLFKALFNATGDAKWREAADRTFAWLEDHPLRDWNWDGQFEDVQPAAPYKNPTEHNVMDVMMYILERFPGDKARLAQCRRLLEFCEKRFVVWSAPPNHAKWPTPSVLEQYVCFTPIDASAAKMICAYLAIYKAEGRAEDLAKAMALGGTVTRVQKPSGRIPTFWAGDSGQSNERYDWLNCMESAAAALLELSNFESNDLADKTCWNDLIPGALDESADFENGVWTFSNGVLTASKDSALWFKGDYSDFALDLEYKLDPAANSGVIIYTSDIKDWVPNSVEVQLLDDYADKWKSDPPRLKNGGLYGHVGPEKSCCKPAGEWNSLTIWARGDHVKVMVNGVVTVDDDLSRYTSAKTNPDGTPIQPWLSKPLAGLPKHGAIGLQGMHGGARPYFRNLRIRPLGKQDK